MNKHITKDTICYILSALLIIGYLVISTLITRSADLSFIDTLNSHGTIVIQQEGESSPSAEIYAEDLHNIRAALITLNEKINGG